MEAYSPVADQLSNKKTYLNSQMEKYIKVVYKDLTWTNITVMDIDSFETWMLMGIMVQWVSEWSSLTAFFRKLFRSM